MQGIVDDALRKVEAAGHAIKTVLVFDHKLAAKREDVAFTQGRDVWWQDAVSQHPTHCDIEWMGAEDPLFKVGASRHMPACAHCPSWAVADEAEPSAC